MIEAVYVVFSIVVVLAFLTFTRALTAKMVTGKWPHEDVTSKSIFEDLP